MQRQTRSWLLLALLCLCSPAAVAKVLRTVAPDNALHVDTAQLDGGERRMADQVVQATLAQLPPAWRQALGPLRIGWRDDLPEAVHGRARGKHIWLRRQLLRDASASAASAVDRRRAMLALQRALIHELAHALDRSPGGALSRERRLLDLAGWPVLPLRFGLRSRRNDFRERSPDLYELHNPREFVAVNLEYFVLDPEYRCRRPALDQWFRQRLGAPPQLAAATRCSGEQTFVEADDTAAQLLRLDPARIYAVDYLLAEGNAQPMSRWGHSMLRLVICAPGRAPGPECRLDLQYQRVLSFRAFVDDVQISSWHGLTGAYPSRLFVLSLDQVIDEYTQVELRDLRSVPLRLSREETAQLLQRAAQVHWSYDGRYYFISNNCAVETWKLLADGVPRLGSERLRSITPTGLLRRLQAHGLTGTDAPTDPAQAIREGYRFQSQAAQFQTLFAVARDALQLPQEDAMQWMDADPAQRAHWFDRADLRSSAALLVLEQAALRREQLQARDELKRRLGAGAAADDTQGIGGVDDELARLMADPAWSGRPARLLAGGYGLPQAEELARLGRDAPQRAARLRASRAHLRIAAEQMLPAARRERLQVIRANVEHLGARLRRLDIDRR